eukprot:3922731-Amphidinium_carterae.1
MHLTKWYCKHPSREQRKHHLYDCACKLLSAIGSSGWALLIESLNAHGAQTVTPENKATALLKTHLQRSDTCRKPGTAFTTEYQIPGTDVKTLVVQAFVQKCSVMAIQFQSLPQKLNNGPWRDYSLNSIQCWVFLEPTLRSERTLQSTSCKPSSFHEAPIRILLFSADVPFASTCASHICRESATLTSRTTSARVLQVG